MTTDDPRVGRGLSWVSEGQMVWAPDLKGNAVLCVVTVAAGLHARVRCDRHGVDGWREVHDLLEHLPRPDPA